MLHTATVGYIKKCRQRKEKQKQSFAKSFCADILKCEVFGQASSLSNIIKEFQSSHQYGVESRESYVEEKEEFCSHLSDRLLLADDELLGPDQIKHSTPYVIGSNGDLEHKEEVTKSVIGSDSSLNHRTDVFDSKGDSGQSDDVRKRLFGSCCELGQRIIEFLLREEQCDVTLNINSERVTAHSCVLRARSSYFRTMLNGSWGESNTADISLHGVNAGAVRVAVLCMYGAYFEDLDSMLSHSCTVSDLLIVADMYEIRSMTELIALHLEIESCHLLHKTCDGCVAGVLRVLPLCELFTLTTLWKRCVQWVQHNLRHVCSIRLLLDFPSSTLHHLISDLSRLITPDNVLDMAVECAGILDRLPTVKQRSCASAVAVSLAGSCMQMITHHFSEVLTSKSLQALSGGPMMSLSRVEEILREALGSVPNESACLLHQQISALHQSTAYTSNVSAEFREFLYGLLKACEKLLITNISHVVSTEAWNLYIPPDIQQHIMTEASFVLIGDGRSVCRSIPARLRENTSRQSAASSKRTSDKVFFSRSSPTSSKSSQKVLTSDRRLRKPTSFSKTSTNNNSISHSLARDNNGGQSQAEREPIPSVSNQSQAESEPMPSVSNQSQAESEPRPSVSNQSQADSEPRFHVSNQSLGESEPMPNVSRVSDCLMDNSQKSYCEPVLFHKLELIRMLVWKCTIPTD